MTDQELLDIMQSYELAMLAEGLNPDMVSRIQTTVGDAIDNNMDCENEED